jgi:hypothetical protein
VLILRQKIKGEDLYAAAWLHINRIMSALGAKDRQQVNGPNSTFKLARVTRNGSVCSQYVCRKLFSSPPLNQM